MNRTGKLRDFLLHSIKGRIISGVLLLHAVLMGLVVWDMITRQQEFMTVHIATEGQVLADSLAVNAPSWVLSQDVNALGELVTSLKSIENLQMAAVMDVSGRVLAATDPDLFNMTLTDEISTRLFDALRSDPARSRHQQWHDGVIDSLSRISSNGQPVGYVRVILDAAPVQTELNAISRKGLAYTLVAIVLGGIIAWLLVRQMTYRLNLLSGAADRIASGDLEVSLPHYTGKDEVARLTRDFSLMTSALQRNSLERDRAVAALYSEKERALVTLQSIGDAVITTDMEGRVESLNPVAETLAGWSNEEAKGHLLTDVFNIVSELTRLPMENPVEKALRANAVVGLADHTVLIRRDGTEVQIEDSAAPIRGRDGSMLGAVLVFHDVSEKRLLTNQLSYQASHDALTGLINRGEFEHRLDALIRSALEEGEQHALLYLDLDQFKVVNDTCGHGAGDELLRQLSARFRHKLREPHTFARLGGDEFGVLLEDCSLEHAQRVAMLLLDEVQDFRFVWLDKTFAIGASIGLVAITDSSGNAASILSAADTACYAAKDKGRNRVQLYSPNDAEMAKRYGEMHWLARITKAFEENRFHLHYQPIVRIKLDKADTTRHYEILLRMYDEDNKLVLPGSFIPAAEHYNRMVEIDRWVVRNALASLTSNPPQDVVCAINLSGHSVNDERFLDFLIEQIETSGVPSHKICFEITETVAITNLMKASSFIRTIKSMGCQFSLDDFGSGMSSFTYLKNLSVDFLKIDGSFVTGMMRSPVDRAMVESINNIGHILGIKTIAEFVESDGILEQLRDIGVDYAQGFGIAKPVPLQGGRCQ